MRGHRWRQALGTLGISANSHSGPVTPALPSALSSWERDGAQIWLLANGRSGAPRPAHSLASNSQRSVLCLQTREHMCGPQHGYQPFARASGCPRHPRDYRHACSPQARVHPKHVHACSARPRTHTCKPCTLTREQNCLPGPSLPTQRRPAPAGNWMEDRPTPPSLPVPKAMTSSSAPAISGRADGWPCAVTQQPSAGLCNAVPSASLGPRVYQKANSCPPPPPPGSALAKVKHGPHAHPTARRCEGPCWDGPSGLQPTTLGSPPRDVPPSPSFSNGGQRSPQGLSHAGTISVCLGPGVGTVFSSPNARPLPRDRMSWAQQDQLSAE